MRGMELASFVVPQANLLLNANVKAGGWAITFSDRGLLGRVVDAGWRHAACRRPEYPAGYRHATAADIVGHWV
jgi:hypothetical protein